MECSNLEEFRTLLIQKIITMGFVHGKSSDGPQQMIICLLNEDIMSPEGRTKRALLATTDFKEYAQKYEIKGCFIKFTQSKEREGFFVQFFHPEAY